MTTTGASQVTAPFGQMVTAMITPMTPDGAVDYDGAARLAEYLVTGMGNDGLVVNGTTGEAPTTTVVRNSPQVIALNPVLAIVGKTKLVPRPAGTPNYPQLSTAIYTNVNAALAGSSSTASALAAAQSAANTALTSPAGGL